MRRHAKAIVAASALLLLTMALGVNFATATAPTVSIDAPSSVSYTSVHVSGKVDPEDQDTYYYFQYTTEPGNPFNWQYAGFDGSLAANSGEATVEGDLTGLNPSTEYFVRVVAENADGQTISSEPHPSFTTGAVGPASASIDSPAAITSSGAHFSGTVDPEAPGGNPAAFDVSWSFQCTPECPGLSGGTIAADSDPHAVEADATDLKPGTTYEVTLVATNAGGQASAGPESFTTDAVAPEVKGQSAQATSTEATLHASINPGGLATTYRFEYGPTTDYGQSTTPKTIKAGGDPVAVQASLLGLTPSSDYHYRVVASNAQGTAEGPDWSFATGASGTGSDNCPNAAIRARQGSAFLPECRAYEMVSPANKDGKGITFRGNLPIGRVMTSRSGERATFPAWSNLPGTQLDGKVATYRSVRTSAGWKSERVSPPMRDMNHGMVTFFNTVVTKADSSLERLVGSTEEGLDASDENKKHDDYSYDPSRPPELISRGNGDERTSGVVQGSVEVSDNGRSVYFMSKDHLVAGDALREPGAEDVYQRIDGETKLLNTDANGELPNRCGSELGGIGGNSLDGTGVISRDGSRAFFSTPAGGGGGPSCAEPRQVYMRVDGEETVRISASQRSLPGGGESNAIYMDATPDGHYVFFTSGSLLTDDAVSGSFGPSLYRYDTHTRVLEFVTAEYIEDMLRVSPDGRVVFGEGYTQDVNGYALFAIVDGERHDFAQADFSSAIVPIDANIREAVFTPASGRQLLFSSRRQIGEFDPAGYLQLYLYDLTTDRLVCVSCDPAGQRPEGSAPRSNIGLWGRPGIDQALSADGQAVVFDTQDQLVAADVNRLADVYLYRDGRLSLLSSGNGTEDVEIIGMDPTSTSVFMATNVQMAPADRDGGKDLYVARIGGGFDEPAPEAPRSCDGDSCQPPSAVPAESGIGSQALVAPKRPKSQRAPAGLRVVPRGPIAGRSGSVGLKVPGAGALTAKGSLLLTVKKRVGRAASVEMTVSLNSRGAARLIKDGVLRTRLLLTFTPSKGRVVKRSMSLTYKTAATPKGGRK